MAVTENRLKLGKRTCNVLQNRRECTLTNVLLEYQDTRAQYSTAATESEFSRKSGISSSRNMVETSSLQHHGKCYSN